MRPHTTTARTRGRVQDRFEVGAQEAAVAALHDHDVAGPRVQLGNELDARRAGDERVLLVGRREVAHAAGVAAVGAVLVPHEDDRQVAGAKGVDQQIDVGQDVGGVLDERRTVGVEVLALHVDHQQRRAPVREVVDHGATA